MSTSPSTTSRAATPFASKGGNRGPRWQQVQQLVLAYKLVLCLLSLAPASAPLRAKRGTPNRKELPSKAKLPHQ